MQSVHTIHLKMFEEQGQRPLLLASGSAYRHQLLARLEIPFTSVSPDVDETPQPNETPQALAERLALAKAQHVSQQYSQGVVIGSDQVANLNGRALGKPGNHDRAVSQLQQMSGQTVTFHTAIAVVCMETGFCTQDIANVRVRFRQLEDKAIKRYLRKEKPYDCAGSAKSEGLGIALLDNIDSDDPTALIGLPLIRTARMLRAAGLELY